jgi:hypothetical protein
MIKRRRSRSKQYCMARSISSSESIRRKYSRCADGTSREVRHTWISSFNNLGVWCGTLHSLSDIIETCLPIHLQGCMRNCLEENKILSMTLVRYDLVWFLGNWCLGRISFCIRFAVLVSLRNPSSNIVPESRKTGICSRWMVITYWITNIILFKLGAPDMSYNQGRRVPVVNEIYI